MNPSHESAVHLSALVELVQSLGLPTDVRYARALFERLNIDGSPTLEFQEFEAVSSQCHHTGLHAYRCPRPSTSDRQ